MTSRAQSDRERLLDLFSAVANSNVELVILQKDEPDAVAALHAWAMSVERKIHTQDLDICGMVTWVETGERRRSIQVYTLPSRDA